MSDADEMARRSLQGDIISRVALRASHGKVKKRRRLDTILFILDMEGYIHLLRLRGSIYIYLTVRRCGRFCRAAEFNRSSPRNMISLGTGLYLAKGRRNGSLRNVIYEDSVYRHIISLPPVSPDLQASSKLLLHTWLRIGQPIKPHLGGAAAPWRPRLPSLKTGDACILGAGWRQTHQSDGANEKLFLAWTWRAELIQGSQMSGAAFCLKPVAPTAWRISLLTLCRLPVLTSRSFLCWHRL